MSKKTVYNFLELEFKKLYDDMKIFIENKELRNVFNNHKKLLKDIEKLYNEINKNLDNLNVIKTIYKLEESNGNI